MGLGIHYRSRLGDELLNWALFERPDEERPVVNPMSREISPNDPDLQAALRYLEIELV